MKGTYIFLAQGYEPLEALAPMDILNRANVKCHFVATTDDVVMPSTQGYGIQTTMTWDEFLKDSSENGIECMIFPGGLPGADNLGTNAALMEILKKHYAAGGLTCAICAAPGRVLARNLGSSLAGKKMTAYDGFGRELETVGAYYTAADVEVDGNLITAKGPGLAIDFGLAILDRLVDHRIYEVVKHAMML